MPRSFVRVIKVGGSLLDLPDLQPRLLQWLQRQTPGSSIFVAGGGKLANAIRELDRLHHLGEQQAHWLCIEAMSLSANILHTLIPDSLLLDDVSAVASAISHQRSEPLVFDTANFLRESEPHCPGTRLEHSWHVTSDSIAARVAEIMDADELVLLKSALPPVQTLESASTLNYVDAHMPIAAAGLRGVRCVNLRDDAFAEYGFK